MTTEVTTIDQALASFLAAKKATVKPRVFRNSVDVIDLLKMSMNGYAYGALSRFDRKRWDKAFEAGDEEAYTKLFGADKIPGHLGAFLAKVYTPPSGG